MLEAGKKHLKLCGIIGNKYFHEEDLNMQGE